MNKSSTGLDENVAGLLCYVAGWISGLVFFFIEKDSKKVRFHGMQSVIVFGVLTAAQAVLGNLPWPVGISFNSGIGVLMFACWIIGMVKAYQGNKFKFPWAGDLADKVVG